MTTRIRGCAVATLLCGCVVPPPPGSDDDDDVDPITGDADGDEDADGDSGGACDDSCPTAFDGECDDGGEGALYDICTLGTDCADCGPRGPGSDGDGGDGGGCVPDCAGRECGDDGCGGTCGGGCANGQSCANGVCSGPDCTPSGGDCSAGQACCMAPALQACWRSDDWAGAACCILDGQPCGDDVPMDESGGLCCSGLACIGYGDGPLLCRSSTRAPAPARRPRGAVRAGPSPRSAWSGPEASRPAWADPSGPIGQATARRASGTTVRGAALRGPPRARRRREHGRSGPRPRGSGGTSRRPLVTRGPSRAARGRVAAPRPRLRVAPHASRSRALSSAARNGAPVRVGGTPRRRSAATLGSSRSVARSPSARVLRAPTRSHSASSRSAPSASAARERAAPSPRACARIVSTCGRSVGTRSVPW